MADMTDAGKRDFVRQVLEILGHPDTIALLTGAGFDPASRTTQLDTKADAASREEGEQLLAQQKAMQETHEAQQALDDSYRFASSTVEVVAGMLGENHPLIRRLRQLRSTGPQSAPANPTPPPAP